MPVSAAKDPRQAIGRAPEQLTLAERTALAAQYVAFEVYTPKTLPLRKIEAIGNSLEECIRELAGRGLDPGRFQFTRLGLPY